jgi:hypothetical protein
MVLRSSATARVAALAAVLCAACGGSTPVPVTPTPTPGVPKCTLGNGVQSAKCGAGAWAEDIHYYFEELVTFDGSTYYCKKEHTSTEDNRPGRSPGTWANLGPNDKPLLGDAVNAAIDKLILDKPSLFDRNQEANAGQRDYLILDIKAYFAGVVSNLQAAGYCAQADAFNDHRIKIKNVADFSEDYNISTVDLGFGSHIQRSADAFDRTCKPAAFPLDRNPDVPPPDQGCYDPFPPPISSFGIKVELKNGDFWTLDSTPQIRANGAYCAQIGYTDGRTFCPVRAEGTAQRVPCEGWRVGIAKDTGLLGPTWTRDGAFCTGEASGCANDPHNQFHVLVYASDGGSHNYKACTDVGFCGSLDVDH